ncbi:MAG: methylmalonyl-CoA mutase family protein [Maricaulaceae bacterium]
MTDSSLTLTENFPSISEADWVALVEKGLKGGALSDIAAETRDGLPRGPLSTAAERPNGAGSFARVGDALLDTRAWHMAAPVTDPDIAYANTQAVEDLTGGASALRVMVGGITAGPNGVTLRTRGEAERLFDKVYTDLIPISFAPHTNGDLAAILAALPALHGAQVNLGLTPHRLSGTGASTETLKEIITWANANAPKWRAITIDAASVETAGGTAAQELSYMASSLAGVLRDLGPEAASHIAIELSADQDGHMGIAKQRAARRIIAQILSSFGSDLTTLPIHAITSLRMMQSTDPWTNMLRVMSAGFGAVCGGADSVTTRPFTDALSADGKGHATAFGHRIARNMQILMMEESHLGHVMDAANGSYFHERMTDALASAAWTEFQAIESGGGIAVLLDDGIFQTSVAASAEAEAENPPPIVGVTLHAAESLRDAKLRKAPTPAASKAKPITDGSFADKIKDAHAGHQIAGHQINAGDAS